MRCFAFTTIFWAIAGLVAAALIVGFGLYNVSAKQGHLPPVSWLLHTTYRNSVQLRAPSESAVPDLSDPDLAALGAKHYDAACRTCHASPGERQSETALRMVPHPPHIENAIHKWEPRHLFWIVKNGVKMTGMPAWPSATRDDDVWAVVAFLMKVPDMDAQTYRGLAGHAEPGSPQENITAWCETCHTPPGEGVANRHIPRLDIQSEAYLRASLEAYKKGGRHSGVMQHAASGLSDAQIAELARHFSSRPTVAEAVAAGPTEEPLGPVEAGRKLAQTAPSANVPACGACHGPWPTRRSDRFPSLAGQSQTFLYTQLKLWKSGQRGGTELAHLMHKVVPALDDEQMRALAAYYASLPPRKNDALTTSSRN